MTVAPFVPGDFRAQFPEFTALSDGLATGYFNRAALQVDNTDASPVPCDPVSFQPRQAILYLLTAHIAKMSAPNSMGGNAGAMVGRMDSAAEGSVNVSYQLEGNIGSRAWWSQTEYGLEAWNALTPWRSALYVAAPPSAAAILPGRRGFGAWPW